MSETDWIIPFCEHQWPEPMIGVLEWLIREFGFTVIWIGDRDIRLDHPTRGERVLQRHGTHPSLLGGEWS